MDLLLLEHDHRILFDVAHVDLIQHRLLLHAQLPELGVDLGLHKVLIAVVGIVGRLERLVVEAVTTHPLVNATLLEKRNVCLG